MILIRYLTIKLMFNKKLKGGPHYDTLKKN